MDTAANKNRTANKNWTVNKNLTADKDWKSLLAPQFGKRCAVLCAGLFIMAMGVAFSIGSDLGTSPISSLPYVVSLFTPLTVGNITIIMHCVFIALQIIILRKDYQLIQLLQLPVAIIFGYLTDLCVWIVDRLSYQFYIQQWIFCVISILLVAFGVSLEVLSKVTTLAGEGFILAVCKKLPIKFGNMKVIFDVSLVVTASIISIVSMHGLYGVREGTIAAAICVGFCSKQMLKPLAKFEDKYLM